MAIKVEHKQFEIFCGTGGVGKTTLSTARAVQLARDNKKVLLITIDPSRRLKEIVGIDDFNAGTIHSINDVFASKPKSTDFSLDVVLMSPWATISQMAKEIKRTDILENKIIKILFQPNGGMNEIMAVVEVYRQIRNKNYDSIILDTPPGNHFVDFLKNFHRVSKFFEQNFIEIFQYWGKKVEGVGESKPWKVFSMIISSGMKKLMSYLEKVTGTDFMEDFVDSLVALYKLKDQFLEALQLEHVLTNSAKSNWFLVASVEHDRLADALEMQGKSSQFIHEDNYLIINKSLQKLVKKSADAENSKEMDYYDKWADYIKYREKKLRREAMGNNVLAFTEILDSSPLCHVDQLARQWHKATKR